MKNLRYVSGYVDVTDVTGKVTSFKYADLMRIFFRDDSVLFVFRDQTTKEVFMGSKTHVLRREVMDIFPSWHWGNPVEVPQLKDYLHHK